ncbi:MAG: hypothetical protein JW953_17265 [Anaerolineae bacterium]|nr:hypothetical protein [Anaerolineae bacterium]
MEKVINEFRVIETDDGFRLEIKGDKEAIREMLHGFGPRFSHHHRRKKHPGHGFGFSFGPHFWAEFGNWCGPWWNWEEEEEEEKEDTPKAA